MGIGSPDLTQNGGDLPLWRDFLSGSEIGLLDGMIVEQDVIGLQEVKVRVEKLLRYYSEMGESRFVAELEARLSRVSDALGGRTGSVRC